VSPIIYCISEGEADDDNFSHVKPRIVAAIAAASACGITHFQIREKKLMAANLFTLAAEAAIVARECDVKLLVNGRADIAVAAGADGAHLPADGLPAAVVRRLVPAGFLIGVSTHSFEEVAEARDAGADLAVFGPLFSSPGKGDGVGLAKLAAVCSKFAPFPVVALGGINETRVEAVIGAGAAGYAAIRYLNRCINDGVSLAHFE